MKHQMAIADRVISARFGIGTITGIDKMESSADEFYVVTPDQSSLKVLVSCTHKKQMRRLASSDILRKNLCELKNASFKKQFTSKKDMIAYYKELSKGCTLEETVDAIGQLAHQPHKGAMENKLLKSMIDLLSLEIATVMDENIENAKNSILARLDNE